jgi:hypothetical protein
VQGVGRHVDPLTQRSSRQSVAAAHSVSARQLSAVAKISDHVSAVRLDELHNARRARDVHRLLCVDVRSLHRAPTRRSLSSSGQLIDPRVELHTAVARPTGHVKATIMHLSDQAPFYSGGPFVDLQNRIHQRRPAWSPAYTALAFTLITWGVPEVLATFGGLPQSRAFFGDVVVQLRLLVVGPLAILVEPPVGARLSGTTRNFVETGIVQGEQVGRFDHIVERMKRLRDSVAPEVVILGAVYLLSVLLSQSNIGQSTASMAPDRWDGWTLRSSAAWFWYAWVSRPLLHFLLLRWLWRTFIWAFFLFRTSRLSLQLSAANPDRAGGLGFVTHAQSIFALVVVPFAILWAAGWGESFVHGGTTVDALKSLLGVFIVLVFLVFAGPLAVFTPTLLRLRRHALHMYGHLSNEYCRQFERRWLSADPPPADESLLGSADIQSFADLQNTVSAVHASRSIPIDRTLIKSLLAATLVPMLPLLAFILPLKEILKKALLPFL